MVASGTAPSDSGVLGGRVDEHDVEIGGVAELATAELAEPEHRVSPGERPWRTARWASTIASA